MEAIKFEKVHFSYEDADDAEVFASDSAFSLCGIDLTVEEGEFVAVLGHNVSG
jgi:ABC-type siderophore export system fused ATPase/permease subunit